MNRLVVVSNRIADLANGTQQAGGLAVALGGLLQKRGGMWFGWSGRIAKDGTERPVELHNDGPIAYATIDLTPNEHQGYYTRFSNSVLWPLLHTLPELMTYDRRDAQTYHAVNARVADALAPLLRPTDFVWIHDYHLLPLPALLRAHGRHNLIGFFLHVPFPAPDLIASVPDLTSMIEGMLAADLVGFQTEHDADNFIAAAQEHAGAVLLKATRYAAQDEDRAPRWLQLGERRTRIGVFPVEIDAREFADTAAHSVHESKAQQLRKSLGLQRLILGVDRLDPTKGLLQRLAGLRRLFERYPEWRRGAALLQIAAVSRGDVPTYRELRRELDREAGNLNGDLGDPDWVPLRLVAKAGPRQVLAGYMRQAKVGLVTPLRDGMNLVAKEFVAAQDPQDPGVLVLSRFAGAAKLLKTAVLVNPRDADEVADALNLALRMELPERRMRWEEMWRAIKDKSSVGWGRAFLGALLRTAEPSRAEQIGGAAMADQRFDLVERVRGGLEQRREPGLGSAVPPAGILPGSLLRPN